MIRNSDPIRAWGLWAASMWWGGAAEALTSGSSPGGKQIAPTAPASARVRGAVLRDKERNRGQRYYSRDGRRESAPCFDF